MPAGGNRGRDRPAVEARAGGCRFPLWADGAPPDGRFCGAPCAPWPTSGAVRPATYCADHLRRVIARAAQAHPEPEAQERP